MTGDEFAKWMSALVEERRLAREAANELIDARRGFDQQRERLLNEYQGRVVGVAGSEVLHAGSVTEILAMAQAMDRLVYFERADGLGGPA